MFFHVYPTDNAYPLAIFEFSEEPNGQTCEEVMTEVGRYLVRSYTFMKGGMILSAIKSYSKSTKTIFMLREFPEFSKNAQTTNKWIADTLEKCSGEKSTCFRLDLDKMEMNNMGNLEVDMTNYYKQFYAE